MFSPIAERRLSRSVCLVADLLEGHDLLLAHGRNDRHHKILAGSELCLQALADLVIGRTQVILCETTKIAATSKRSAQCSGQQRATACASDTTRG